MFISKTNYTHDTPLNELKRQFVKDAKALGVDVPHNPTSKQAHAALAEVQRILWAAHPTKPYDLGRELPSKKVAWVILADRMFGYADFAGVL